MADLSLDILPQANADLEDIWLYTAETWSFAQANAYITNLHASLETLCQMPTIARERVEITPPVRVHPSGQHYVIYRAEGASLVVLRVLHNRRDWKTILET